MNVRRVGSIECNNSELVESLTAWITSSTVIKTTFFYGFTVICNYLVLLVKAVCPSVFCSFSVLLWFNLRTSFSPTFKQPFCIPDISFVCRVIVGHTSSAVRKLNSVTHIFLPFLHRNVASFYHPGLSSTICGDSAASVTTCYPARARAHIHTHTHTHTHTHKHTYTHTHMTTA
jgi:hypothetical protein